MKRIFSGIKPTGDSTLGNYSGGYRQYVATQEQGEGFFCIVDLHAITVEHDPDELRRLTLHIAAMLFATGLDADRSTVFVQSHVAAHSEAAWLLGSSASFGELRRMTQFKEKADQQEFVSSALFQYPVLMAGDILLYQTNIVPIGDDQRQHLELTRDIAQRFNHRYGETFTIPDGVYPEVGARIMDLQDPDGKMGKTGSSGHGTILMLDSADAIRAKFKTAVTDSGREVLHTPEKPGISNLIEITTVATGESIPEVEARFDGQGYGVFKDAVAEAVIELLEPIRRRYEEIRSDEPELTRMLALGAEKARNASAPTLRAMYERMGFVAP
jgi:tryptophanyl-tRNA synthetase